MTTDNEIKEEVKFEYINHSKRTRELNSNDDLLIILAIQKTRQKTEQEMLLKMGKITQEQLKGILKKAKKQWSDELIREIDKRIIKLNIKVKSPVDEDEQSILNSERIEELNIFKKIIKSKS